MAHSLASLGFVPRGLHGVVAKLFRRDSSVFWMRLEAEVPSAVGKT